MKKKCLKISCVLLVCMISIGIFPVSSFASGNSDATITSDQLEAFVQEAENQYATWGNNHPGWANREWCAYFVRICLSAGKIGDYYSNGAGDLAREIGKKCASAVYYTASKEEASRCNLYQLVDMNEYVPQRGDIIVYKRNDSDYSGAHTGIVTNYDPSSKKVTTIEGNTSVRLVPGGKIKKRTIKLRSYVFGIGRIASYVRFKVSDAAQNPTLGDVALTSQDMHAIEALTSFFYGSQYWKWNTSAPLYDDVLKGLQALFFFEEDFVGTNSYKELDTDGYLVCEMISEEKLNSFLLNISGYGLPSDAGSNLDFDQIGYYISDGYYQFYPTDYNQVPYIVAVKSLGSDVLVVHAIMRSSLDSENAPTEEELNSQTQYDMYLHRNSKSPYGFTLEWRPQGEIETGLDNGALDGAATEPLETQGDTQEQHDSVQDAITWHDAFLENGIRKALGKNANQEISPEELASIKTLTILGGTVVINDRAFWEGYGDVKDVGKIDGHDKSYFGSDPYHPEQTTGTISLQDLKYLPNLESLNLLSISIQDLKGINNCKNLKNLRVHGCNGFSFAALSRAVPLQEVYIWCQQDVNVKDLLGFDQLELLDVYCSPLDGTEYLAELTSLQHLGLYWSGGSNLSDVEFLYQLPNLTFLSLGEDYVEDIAPISALTHLKSLYLSRCVLDDQDMKNISRLTGLVHFGADALGWDDGLQSPLEDLSFLRNLTDLEDISLDFNDVEIGALTPLENLDNLRSLSLEGAFFTSDSDYRTLSKLTGLRELNLKGNSIVDIDIISKFTNLEILNLSNTSLRDIHFLSNFTKLEILDLSENSLEDIQSLSKLVHLKSLSLSGNLKFSNLSPLHDCEALEELDIGWTAVTDVSALQGLPLKKIYIKDKTLEHELRTMFPNAEIIIE